MTAQQRHEHREFYNQLRLAIVFPGDEVAGVTKAYTPVNKFEMTWEELMLTPDTPAVARYRQTRETSMWFAIGQVA